MDETLPFGAHKPTSPSTAFLIRANLRKSAAEVFSSRAAGFNAPYAVLRCSAILAMKASIRFCIS